jgi:hypothetical protein
MHLKNLGKVMEYLIPLTIGHPNHSPLSTNVSKVHGGIKLGYYLFVPILSEPHKHFDPLPLTVAYDFIKDGVILPSHMLPIHILCLTSDFGLFDDYRSIVVLLKLSPKPQIRRGSGLLIRVLIP